MASRFFTFIWPMSESYRDDKRLTDIEGIKSSTWKQNPEAFLDEARRLRDIENARNSSADTKSQIYLGTLLTLIPIVVSMSGPSFFSGLLLDLDLRTTLILVLFVLGFSYGAAAVYFAFNTLKVEAYHRVDIDELINESSSDDPLDGLIKQILLSVRLDRMVINRKVGLVKLAQRHIARMVLMFIIGFFLLEVWPHILNAAHFMITSN